MTIRATIQLSENFILNQCLKVASISWHIINISGKTNANYWNDLGGEHNLEIR